MKSRPILFSAPMIRALLREVDPKTQTRRIVKPQPPSGVDVSFAPIYCGPHVESDPRPVLAWREPGFFEIEKRYCPYGVIGDRLWVRETFTEMVGHHVIDGKRWAYAADCTDPDSERCRQDYIRAGYPYRWKPSIHMPRAASRITLEITEVRVERLQDISEEDAKAEGACEEAVGKPDGSGSFGHVSCIPDYRAIWESINGAGSWDLNPWVWAVSFKRAEAKP